MFPAYSSAQQDSGEIRDGSQGSDNNSDPFSSFCQKKILEKRKKRFEISKENKRIEHLKSLMTFNYIKSSESEDEGEACKEAIHGLAEHLVKLSQSRKDLPPQQKTKKAKKSKKKKKKKNKTSKRRDDGDFYSSSDSDNSCSSHDERRSSSPQSSTRSRSRNRKKAKHYRNKSSSSDPPKERNFKIREKWSFLNNNELESRLAPYIVNDRLHDSENLQYDEVTKSQRCLYNLRIQSILSGNAKMDKIFYPLADLHGKNKVHRYFHGKLRGLNERDAENKFERRTPMYRKEMSFVPLSQERWRPFEFKDDVAKRKEEEKKIEEEKRQILDVCPSEVADLELRRRVINLQLSREPKNVDLYLKFLELEDEIFERNRERGIQNNDHNALRERKLAIVDVAIKNNPRDPGLRIRRLDIMKDSHDLDDLISQWDKLLNIFVNSCDIWEKYLDAIQYDSKMYSFSRMEKAFDRCIDKLESVLKGIIRSHKPEEGTASFILSIYIRRLRWWIETGYTSRAVASIQATLEFNLLVPNHLKAQPEHNRLNSFRDFWGSGVPRIGDNGAKGWNNYKPSDKANAQTMEKVDIEIQRIQQAELEKRIGESMADNVALWVEMERSLDDIECRPRRCEQEDSIRDIKPVSFDELRIFISKDNSFIYPLLVTMGARLIFHDSPWVNTVDLVEEWGLPRLNGRSPPLSILKIVERIISFLLSLAPSIEFIAAVLATHASFVDNFAQMPPKTRICSICEVGKQLADNHKHSLGDSLDIIISVLTLKLSMKWMISSKSGKREQLRKIRRVKQMISSHNSGSSVCDFEPMQIQLLLTLLLLEIQLVPAEEVLGILTQFVLRTTTGNESKTHPLAAVEQWKVLGAHLANIQNGFTSIFESPNFLCIAVRIHFEYARATKSSVNWTMACDSLFRSGCTPNAEGHDVMVVLLAYTDVLKSHWAHKSVLIDVLRVGYERFPYDCSLFKKYIDARSDFVKMRIELANMKTTRDSMINTRNSLACMYLEWKNYQKRLACANIYDSKEMGSRIMLATYRREAQRRKDPLLWRMAMSQEWNEKRMDEIHILAMSQCVWSRNLHIDRAAASLDQKMCNELTLLMMEKGVLSYIELEEIDILKKGYAIDVGDVRDLMGEDASARMISS